MTTFQLVLLFQTYITEPQAHSPPSHVPFWGHFHRKNRYSRMASPDQFWNLGVLNMKNALLEPHSFYFSATIFVTRRYSSSNSFSWTLTRWTYCVILKPIWTVIHKLLCWQAGQTDAQRLSISSCLIKAAVWWMTKQLLHLSLHSGRQSYNIHSHLVLLVLQTFIQVANHARFIPILSYLYCKHSCKIHSHFDLLVLQTFIQVANHARFVPILNYLYCKHSFTYASSFHVANYISVEMTKKHKMCLFYNIRVQYAIHSDQQRAELTCLVMVTSISTYLR